MTNTCEHGHFARVCEMCDRDRRIKELEAEVERLRSVCRLASKAIADDIRNAAIDGVAKRQLILLAEDLANEGSKDGK